MLVFLVSLSVIHRALVLHMLQNKSLAISDIPVLGPRLYKLNEILILQLKKNQFKLISLKYLASDPFSKFQPAGFISFPNTNGSFDHIHSSVEK